MIIERVVMPTTAKRTFNMSYPWLLDTETILAAPLLVAITPDDGLFTITDLTVVDSKEVQFKASGNGTAPDGETYHVEITVETSAGNINPDCLEFIMEDC